MPKMIYICILLIYFKVISKKGGHYCPRLPYQLGLYHRLIIGDTDSDQSEDGRARHDILDLPFYRHPPRAHVQLR